MLISDLACALIHWKFVPASGSMYDFPYDREHISVLRAHACHLTIFRLNGYE